MPRNVVEPEKLPVFLVPDLPVFGARFFEPSGMALKCSTGAGFNAPETSRTSDLWFRSPTFSAIYGPPIFHVIRD